ncbi:oligosaccharide flippase family protein [Halorubrum ezzemoulense]|uniref:Uncharacterized protein n=1 Tax=Halorubrum ezzemoulense TaxID=337243 RepID=A0A256KD89_HALEZ|nr:polysaccharide biosynthesis C-terminal domain-containing protein [Halorubrum ezzemoulense]OYR78367.1 hypothetical protein DJ77_01150 [Halorubrum ezzemoulense]QAY21070.1 hypothetical protein EO776_14140 [Halorubrum ezzemoulense]
MNIGKEASKLFTSLGASQIIYFIATAYFASILGPDNIGSFYLFESVLIFTSIFADLGIKGGIKKRISEDGKNSKEFTSGLMLKSIALLVSSLLLIIFSEFVTNYIGLNYFPLVLLSVVIFNLYETVLFAIQGEKKIGVSASMKFINRFVWAFLGIILIIKIGTAIQYLIISYICGTFLALLFGLYYLDVGISIPDRHSFNSIIDYSKYNLISSVSGFSFGWLDVAMLGLLVNPTAVGLYETAWRVTGVIAIIANAISTTIFPAVSEASSHDRLDKVKEITSRSLFTSLYLSIPAVVGLIFISHEILFVIFGSEYTAAASILAILAVHKFLLSINAIVGQALHAINLPSAAAKASGYSTVTNLFLNYIFISRYGAIGAAIATIIAYTLNTLLHYYYLKMYVNISILSTSIKTSSYSAIVVILVLFTKEIFDLYTVFGLSISITITALFYFGVTLSSTKIRTNVFGIWNLD